MKSFADGLGVTCDEIVNIPQTAPINHSHGINHRFIAVVLLAIACLLLLVQIVCEYYIKYALTVPCLIFY